MYDIERKKERNRGYIKRWENGGARMESYDEHMLVQLWSGYSIINQYIRIDMTYLSALVFLYKMKELVLKKMVNLTVRTK